MTMHRPPSPTVRNLARDLCGGGVGHPLEPELAGWLAGSARFRTFAEVHRDKIRKKLRATADPESMRDVRAELEVARLLLADRRIELVFEAYGSGRAGPDFSATFRAGARFNVEVTRLRRLPDTADVPPLLTKLRQLPPSIANLLVVVIAGVSADALDVGSATRSLRARADAKDDAFFARRGLDGSREFYERYLRLSAVVVWAGAAVGDGRASLWMNASARIALPGRSAQACLTCLRAST
jgi:hypothetical protein